MRRSALILTLTASFGLGIFISSAATVAFQAAVRTTTDVDWPSVPTNPSPFPSVTVEKYFTGDASENLSLRMVLTAGGDSTNMRIDGSNAATGWNPDGGANAQSYRWENGEEATWVVSILDLDNASADVTANYQVNLISIQTANRGEIPDDATITLTNGLSDSNTVVAAAGLNTNKVTNFTDFDGTSMTLSMSNNPSPSPHYFRAKTTTFEVTSSEPLAAFQITEVARDAGAGELKITWNSVNGRTYAVDTSTDLQPGWNEVTDDVLADDSETSYDVELPDPAPARFFVRVREMIGQ